MTQGQIALGDNNLGPNNLGLGQVMTKRLMISGTNQSQVIQGLGNYLG